MSCFVFMVGGWLEVFWLPAVLCLAFSSILVVEGVGCCLALLLGLGVFCLACLLFDVCCWGGGLGVSCLAFLLWGVGCGLGFVLHMFGCGFLVVVLFGEFDPGSGRTLAACLTHASRTGLPSFLGGGLSGERVSIT